MAKCFGAYNPESIRPSTAAAAPNSRGRALIFSADGASDPFVAALNRNWPGLWKTARSLNAKKKFFVQHSLLIDVNVPQPGH